MRNGQIKGLLLFCLIFVKACLADDDIITSEPVRAHLGQSVSLSCKVKGKEIVTQSEWTRCNDSSSIAVFDPVRKDEHGPHINEPYTFRVSITVYHTLTINQLQDGDFGEYCCKIATFPKGSLEGRVYILKDKTNNEEEIKEVDKPNGSPAGLPVMMIVYISCGVVGFVILTMIITLLVCRKRTTVRNPVTVTHTSLSPKQPSILKKDLYTPSHTPSHTRKDDEEDDDDDMYLNIKNSEP